jgi:subtilisin family serine protease
MKQTIYLILFVIILCSSVLAVSPPSFKGLIGGKIDPSIGLLKNASITIVHQGDVLIEGDLNAKENVWVEYQDTYKIDTYIPIEWDGYKSKVKKTQVNLDELQVLAKNKDVIAIWSDPKTQALECTVDCMFGFSSYSITDLVQSTGIESLHNLGYTGKGVKVLLVDTGVDSRVKANIAPDLTRGIDYANHGSKSASVIGSQDQNYKGIAPDATIIDCPAVEPATEYSILDCFQWGINKFQEAGYPQIISNSWGFVEPVNPNHATVRKIKEATDKGMIVVFAGSNCGSGCSSYYECCDGSGRTINQGCVEQDRYRGYGKSITGPNQIDDVITVAAVDAETKKREGYSSQGPSYNPIDFYAGDKPNIAGFSDFKVAIGNQVVNYAGTSAATPTITGIIALMMQANPSITPSQVRSYLYSTALAPDSCSGDFSDDIGFGYANAYTAVMQAAGSNLCGNEACDLGETVANCKTDCFCGNNNCDVGENHISCPSDCPQTTCTADTCEYKPSNLTTFIGISVAIGILLFGAFVIWRRR